MKFVIRSVFALVCVGAVFGQQPVARQYSVSTLPSASNSGNGSFAIVRDGQSPLDCSTGGGAYIVTCVSNGSSWVAQSAGAASASTLILANASTTGTTLYKLAKPSGSPSTAVVTSTADTQGALGVVIAGAGTTSSATIQTYGLTSCIFDGATTSGDYVVISSTTAGNCHDSGSTFPTTQPIGRVFSTNGTAGTYSIYLYPSDLHGYVAGGNATKLIATASETPGAIADGTCLVLGTTVTISGAVVGDSVAVGFSPSLASGITGFGQVTSANTVSATLCNSSGVSVTPPSESLTATIIH